MAGDEVGVRQGDIPLHHIERGVTEDALQAEGVSAVDQIRAREGVAQEVGTAAAGDASTRLETVEDLLDTTRTERSTASRAEDRLVRLSPTELAQVAQQRLS